MPRSAAKPAEQRRPREAREPPWSAAENGERVDRLQRHGARGAPRSAAERRGAPWSAKYVAARMPREFELPCSCCQQLPAALA